MEIVHVERCESTELDNYNGERMAFSVSQGDRILRVFRYNATDQDHADLLAAYNTDDWRCVKVTTDEPGNE